MADLERARENLLRYLDRDIADKRVVEAMKRVPREAFVSPEQYEVAYDDRPLGIGWVCNRWPDAGEIGLMGVYATPLSYPFPLEDMNNFLGTSEYAWEGNFCGGAINVSGEEMDPGYFEYGEFPNQTDIVSATGVIVLPQGG